MVALSWVLVLALAPPIPPSRSFDGGALFEPFLQTGAAKQASGFALAGLCLLSLGVSLRKRWRRFQFGDAALWRSIHAILGAASMLLFFLHTGLRAGTNINFALSLTYAAVIVLGAIAGIVFALSSRWSPLRARDRRLRATFVHVLLTWPLPILIAIHVLAVYYY